MGKSTTAQLFAQQGVPVWDADDAVHRLYQPNGAGVLVIKKLVPAAVVDGKVDRSLLRDALSLDNTLFPKLDAGIHPLVTEDRAGFFKKHPGQIVVCDVPLLFETGGDIWCNAIVVVTAPAQVQEARVMAREGMTRDAFQAILARQLPDAEKCARADFVIDTSLGLDHAKARVQVILTMIRGRDWGEDA